MTPKEKAEEIVDKYRGLVISAPYTDLENDYCIAETCMLTRSAQQCALIAVDEIIDAIDWHEYEVPNDQLKFWFEVIKEIEKL